MRKSKLPERIIEFTDVRDLVLYVIGSEVETIHGVREYIKTRMPTSVKKILDELSPDSDIDKIIDNGIRELIDSGVIRKWGRHSIHRPSYLSPKTG